MNKSRIDIRIWILILIIGMSISTFWIGSIGNLKVFLLKEAIEISYEIVPITEIFNLICVYFAYTVNFAIATRILWFFQNEKIYMKIAAFGSTVISAFFFLESILMFYAWVKYFQ